MPSRPRRVRFCLLAFAAAAALSAQLVGAGTASATTYSDGCMPRTLYSDLVNGYVGKTYALVSTDLHNVCIRLSDSTTGAYFGGAVSLNPIGFNQDTQTVANPAPMPWPSAASSACYDGHSTSGGSYNELANAQLGGYGPSPTDTGNNMHAWLATWQPPSSSKTYVCFRLAGADTAPLYVGAADVGGAGGVVILDSGGNPPTFKPDGNTCMLVPQAAQGLDLCNKTY